MTMTTTLQRRKLRHRMIKFSTVTYPVRMKLRFETHPVVDDRVMLQWVLSVLGKEEEQKSKVCITWPSIQ